MKDKLQERQESADTENKSQDVAKGINTAINNVDESLDYRDFAKAVAITLKENYGTHNIAPFMEVLHAGLGINEVKAEDLEEDQSYASSFGTSSKKINWETVKKEINLEGYDTPSTGIWNRILVTKDGKRVGMINTDESSYMKDGKMYKWEGTPEFIDHVGSVVTEKRKDVSNSNAVKKAISQIKEEKPGLWANIRAKKARGEKPAHKNSKAHKDAVKAGTEINSAVNEAKATCCHRCGRVHVKGTPCKKPYLKGKKSCAIKEVQDLQEMYKKIKETKSAPKGHYFTKSGNLVKGRMTKDAEERGARKSDPKDKMRSKIPKVTQHTETLKEFYNK